MSKRPRKIVKVHHVKKAGFIRDLDMEWTAATKPWARWARWASDLSPTQVTAVLRRVAQQPDKLVKQALADAGINLTEQRAVKPSDPELMAALNKWAEAARQHGDYWINRRFNNTATPGMHVVLVGDIVSGFEAYGPFQTGHDAVMWKQQKGVRELTQGQWFIMPLREPKEPTNG